MRVSSLLVHHNYSQLFITCILTKGAYVTLYISHYINLNIEQYIYPSFAYLLVCYVWFHLFIICSNQGNIYLFKKKTSNTHVFMASILFIYCEGNRTLFVKWNTNSFLQYVLRIENLTSNGHVVYLNNF